MSANSLRELYETHQGKVSDKWSIYLTEYDRLFSTYRSLPIRMLEIGVQNGGSLEIWSKYFYNARTLVGCDINDACNSLEFSDPKITVIVADANSEEARAAISKISPQFDIVIDDGSHTSQDIVRSFVSYFYNLVDGGIYVAEDLHCSYWQEYGGGLFDPFSSMTFFKSLADIVNFEHWGIDKERNALLKGFSDKYGLDIAEELLQQVYSVEFLNSLCIVRKSSEKNVSLGKRFIVGRKENVVKDLSNIVGQVPKVLPQSDNYWSTLDRSPSESHADNIRKIDQLANTVNELISENEQHLKTINDLQGSFSWRITRPLRFIRHHLMIDSGQMLYIFRQLMTVSGWKTTYKKFRTKLKNNG
jgi:hypothetical protein